MCYYAKISWIIFSQICQFFTIFNVFMLILKLKFVAIIFTEYIFAYFYVFNHIFIGYVWILKKEVWTSFLGSCHNRQQVAVAVCPNRAKKLDRTRPLNNRFCIQMLFRSLNFNLNRLSCKTIYNYVEIFIVPGPVCMKTGQSW